MGQKVTLPMASQWTSVREIRDFTHLGRGALTQTVSWVLKEQDCTVLAIQQVATALQISYLCAPGDLSHQVKSKRLTYSLKNIPAKVCREASETRRQLQPTGLLRTRTVPTAA